MKRSRQRHHLALLALLSRALMFFAKRHTLHQNLFRFRKDSKNLALLAAVFSGNYLHHISFFYFHTISSASETILLKPFSFISLGIGPKILPPFGSWPSKITTALSSNLIYEPSLRLSAFFWRTTRAFKTSFLLTSFLGSAIFTVTTTLSPIPAY